jgi:hypothetical protein
MREPTAVEYRAFKKAVKKLKLTPDNDEDCGVFIQMLADLYHTTPSGLARRCPQKHPLEFGPTLAFKSDRLDPRDLLPFQVRFGNSRIA